jgi:hypothetical protein
MNGIASRPVWTVPPTNPFRRTDPAMVKTASAPPNQGTDLDRRRAALALPQPIILLVALPIMC